MRWSSSVKDLMDIARSTGKIPTALKIQPEIDEVMDQYMRVFYTLHNARQDGQPIRISEIISYGNAIGETDIVEFIELLSKVDLDFLTASKEYKKNG